MQAHVPTPDGGLSGYLFKTASMSARFHQVSSDRIYQDTHTYTIQQNFLIEDVVFLLDGQDIISSYFR